MKQLLRKEWREQFKFALLGMAILTLLLFINVRSGLTALEGAGSWSVPTGGLQPLVSDALLAATTFFCAIFGALLGWLQMQTEKHPDLRAFLLHRPVPRSLNCRASCWPGSAFIAWRPVCPWPGCSFTF